jgi:hypothetical protein
LTVESLREILQDMRCRLHSALTSTLANYLGRPDGR